MIPSLATLASLLAFASPDPQAIANDVEQILADERYAFCSDERSFVPIGDETAWCPLIERGNRRCPGYAGHCAVDPGPGSGVAEAPAGPGERSVRARRGLFNKGAGGSDEPPSPELQVTREMSALSRLLLWLIAIGGGLLVVWTVARGRSLPGEEEDPGLDDGADAQPALTAADVARRQIETDVSRLLERARQAAHAGEYRRAVDDVYAALLRRLDGDGLIEIHRGRTNGDYLRELRDHPELRHEVREILREIERVQFGDTQPDASLFRRVLDRVVPLVGRQLGALLLAFGLGLGMSACDVDDEHEGLAGLGTEPLGERAVVQLLRRHGVTVHHRTRTIEELRQSDGVLLLLGEVRPTPEEWSALMEWTRDGGILVVATGLAELPPSLGVQLVDGWRHAPDRAALDFVGGYRYTYEGFALRAPRFGHLATTGANFRTTEMIVRPEEGTEPEVDPFYGEFDDPAPRGETYAVRIDEGDGQVVVFADEMLFTNAAMAVDDDAEFVVDFVSSFERDVEVIDAWTGSGAQSPMESIQNSHMTPVVLQLLALLTLFYLWRGVAFARLREPAARGRRAFIAHVHALALQYAKARASRHVLSMYASWVLERLRDRVAPGSDRTLHGLARAVAARTGRGEAAVMRLLVEAYTVREGAAHASGVYSARRRDLELMRELTTLLTQSKKPRKRR